MSEMNELILGTYEGTEIAYREGSDHPMFALHDMAKAHGKLVADYLRLDSTKAYIQAVSFDMGIPISKVLVKSKGGRSASDDSRGGTWAVELVAIDFAQWLSVPFKLWVNKQIRALVNGTPIASRESAEFYFQQTMTAISALAQAIESGFARTDRRLDSIECRLGVVESNQSGSRKNFSKSCQKAVAHVVAELYQGKCPVCRTRQVDRIHHWRSKGGNNPRIAMPVCGKCHDKFHTDSQLHDSLESTFQDFQRLARPTFESMGVIEKKRVPPPPPNFLF